MAGSLLSGKDMTGWMGILLQASVRAVLLLVFTAVLCLVLRRASAAVRHFIWSLAVGSVLCLPLLLLVLPSWQVRGMPRVLSEADSPLQQRKISPPPSGNALEVGFSPNASPKQSAERTVSTPALVTKPLVSARPQVRKPMSLLSPWFALLVIWGLGTLASLLPLLIGSLGISRLRKRSRTIVEDSWRELIQDTSARLHLCRSVRVLWSPLETVPMVWGWLRPVLLLPPGAEDWPLERKRLVLLHELAHIKRADCLTQLLGQLTCALYWFNPLVWMALCRLRCEREQACDDLVLSSGFCGSEYAAHLLSIAKSLRHPICAQTVGIAMARRAGVEARIRALLDPRRSRRSVSRPAAALVISVAAALLFPLASARSATWGTAGHEGAGARQQWQPKLEGGYDSDQRLEQRIDTSIVGQEAIPALAWLSKKTGVSLGVAPEDLETVGVRKLTIMAHGITLKTIMVRLPDALQECHWDIDESGTKPLYLLHRNSDAEMTEKRLSEDLQHQYQDKQRPAREARLLAGLRALEMSPEELAALDKTDPLLARQVKDPEARLRLQMLLSLPQDKMGQFIAEGKTVVQYSSASEGLRGIVQRAVDKADKDAAEKHDSEKHDKLYRDIANLLHASIPEIEINFEDNGADDEGMILILQCYDTKGTFMTKGDFLRNGAGILLPPQFPSAFWGRSYRDLLVSTGSTEKEADATLADLAKKKPVYQRQQEEARRQQEWAKPTDPDLQRPFLLKLKNPNLLDIMQAISKETGWSVISDHFSDWTTVQPRALPSEANQPLPLWRLLDLLGEQRLFRWKKTGQCLVFHKQNWYSLLSQEVPESVVLAYRERLKKQGGFSLADVTQFAASLRNRPSFLSLPRDLEDAGLGSVSNSYWALMLYNSLSPEQLAQARSEAGLSYIAMTPAQQQQVAEQGADRERGYKAAVPAERIPQATFSVKEQPLKNGQQTTLYLFELRFPERVIQAGVSLRLPRTP